MPAKLTTEQFIEKARAVHGNRYDYSLVQYVHSETKVTIICPEHGPFPQTPKKHVNRKQGCPDCGGTRKHTAEKFIDSAKTIHEDRYDYSLVEYVNNATKVKIICPVHDVFEQTPATHLKGSGCKKCGYIAMKKKQRKTQDDFIARAKDLHNDRYDYSLVEYVNGRTKVKIICPVHDVFEQTPENHLTGQGCKICAVTAVGLKRRSNTEEFIQKARVIHEDRYDYSLVEYANNATKVKIICPVHDVFRQTPRDHLRGNGCDNCAPNKKLTSESFIQKAREIHEDRYDYSMVEYVNAHTEVWIICPDHGSFPMTPSNHLHGSQGCPDCAKYGFHANEPAMLYYVAITTDDGDTRYKIGITRNSIERRFFGVDLPRIRVVKTWRYAIGSAAAKREAQILRLYAGDRYYGPPILKVGNTELFTHDILELDKADKTSK